MTDLTREWRLREARRADSEPISILWEQLMEHHQRLDPRFQPMHGNRKIYMRHIQELLRCREARVLVAVDADDKQLLGYIAGELQERSSISLPGLYGFVPEIYVCKEWRHEGIGRALYDDMIAWFVLRKAVAVELFASVANPQALAFWQEMGLTPFLYLMHRDLNGNRP